MESDHCPVERDARHLSDIKSCKRSLAESTKNSSFRLPELSSKGKM